MSQPRDLRPGPWETLFPKALKLIDEIAKYGGVNEPFYTFGGGTVLMLRYQHRLSNDIDIFVPDPQSLGFVRPRLSDTADEMCKSQYSEAENVVKLILKEGEIDFVASPNLLPDQDAFEHWDLFGRSVRAETAAEIVAKKMFHRGDKATARDLFDFALVVEREPLALLKAEAFLYRHLEKFSSNVNAPSAAYVQDFERIETLGYCPTFRHAAAMSMAYIDGMQKRLEQSRLEALAFVSKQELKVSAIDVYRGRYIGPVMHMTSGHLVQGCGRGTVVVHETHCLPMSVRERTSDTASVEFRYHGGVAALANSKSKEVGG